MFENYPPKAVELAKGILMKMDNLAKEESLA